MSYYTGNIPMPKYLSDKELNAKSTERLLNIYRKIRRQTIAVFNIGVCECCHERPGCTEEDVKAILAAHKIWKTYLERIKSILDTRPHVVKPYHHKKNLTLIKNK